MAGVKAWAMDRRAAVAKMEYFIFVEVLMCDRHWKGVMEPIRDVVMDGWVCVSQSRAWNLWRDWGVISRIATTVFLSSCSIDSRWLHNVLIQSHNSTIIHSLKKQQWRAFKEIGTLYQALGYTLSTCELPSYHTECRTSSLFSCALSLLFHRLSVYCDVKSRSRKIRCNTQKFKYEYSTLYDLYLPYRCYQGNGVSRIWHFYQSIVCFGLLQTPLCLRWIRIFLVQG